MITMFKSPSSALSSGIKNTTAQTFKADVIDGSRSVPVVVDFWAPWCEPCRKVSPVLERLVHATKGSVILVKANIDQIAAISQQLGVRSLPCVYAFFQGQPVDYFVGVIPELAIKQFLNRVITLAGGKSGTALESILTKASESLQSGDHQGAIRLFNDVLRSDPSNATAYGGLVRCRIASRSFDQARHMLEDRPDSLKNDKELVNLEQTLDVILDLNKEGKDVRPLDILQPLAADTPDDHHLRFELAMSHYMQNNCPQAMEHLLEIIKHHPQWEEGKAHKQLLKMFQAVGLSDPLTIATRRRLSTLLFS